MTIGAIYHGERAKPLEQLLRRHGAYTPPHKMGVRELKQAIRDNQAVTRHEEFLGNVLAQRNSGLLDLYLDSKRSAAERIEFVPYAGSPALVRRLLDFGLDPNRTDWLGRTALHACAEQGDRAAAAILLNAGADINARELEFRGTPLAAAVRACCIEADPEKARRKQRMVEFLLKRGAATNLLGDEPWSTALAWARKGNRADFVELLKRHGAS